jgi:2,3-bisphosphoglycerate-independent phosphoglycerate mutase
MGSSILFIFLDGVGLAPAGPDNPLSSVPMPLLHGLLGGPMVLDRILEGPGAAPDGVVFRGLDACLGVAGVPQSATGQTALFTGVNAPALVGGHIPAYPTRPLREVIAEHSLLRRAAESGARVLFANAHSERFWQMVRDRKWSLSASTLTALAADARIPTMEDLLQGLAVLWDITHEVTGEHFGWDLPAISPEEAGARLARLAGDYDLVLFETFLPDLAGHRRLDPEWMLPRLDAFLGAAVQCRPPQCTVVVSSDHGNVEDASSKLHTGNPVPLLAIGPQAHCFREVMDITGVAPAILRALGGPCPQETARRPPDPMRPAEHA